jgi:hypothetical protein
MLFKRHKIDLRMIDTSSKIAMKMSCLAATRGNVEQAQQVYDFLSEGITTLPDFTPQPPTTMQQVQQTAQSLFGWFKENQSDLQQAWQFVQHLRGAGQMTEIISPTDIPPLPNPQ